MAAYMIGQFLLYATNVCEFFQISIGLLVGNRTKNFSGRILADVFIKNLLSLGEDWYECRVVGLGPVKMDVSTSFRTDCNLSVNSTAKMLEFVRKGILWAYQCGLILINPH